MGTGVWELQLQLGERINRWVKAPQYIMAEMMTAMRITGGWLTISVCGRRWCWTQPGCRPWCTCRPPVDGGFAAYLKDTDRRQEGETDFKTRPCLFQHRFTEKLQKCFARITRLPPTLHRHEGELITTTVSEFLGAPFWNVQSRSQLKLAVQVFLTWPCQSDVLMRMMLSGRWLSDTRMWFSWSYTVFLGI